ncbi:UDP-N-acetylglucosamine 4,6-dehydratase (inverting) [Fibrobacterota bacterium]
MLNDKNVLITGGTGSFGKKFVEIVLQRYQPKRLIVMSRDELKQYEMAQQFPPEKYGCMRYFLGDIRDKERLCRAFEGIDYVIHAAALKQVPATEYNPFEAVKTNILGAQNIINVAIDKRVKKVLALSTDKATSPANLYGATKLCSEKLFVAGNAYVTIDETIFSIVRYGNVVSSRGSVIPLFNQLKNTGTLPITDPRMTRFWITLEQGVDFVLKCLERMVGGEVFVPKIPSMSIMELAEAIGPDCKTEVVGIRPGEKLHESLISIDEARNTLEFDDYYLIKPSFKYFTRCYGEKIGKPVPEGFTYDSETNQQKISLDDLNKMIA